jgi:hypothetical protein
MKRSSKRQSIIDAINAAGKPIGPREIASIAGMPAQNVRQLLPNLLAEMESRQSPPWRCGPATGNTAALPTPSHGPCGMA